MFKSGLAKYVKSLREAVEKALGLALHEHAARAERAMALVKTRKVQGC